MRIIHILNHVQEIGNGIVNVAVDLACLQAKSGFEVAVVSAGGEYESLLDIYGVKHYQLDQRRKPISIIKAAIRYRAIAVSNANMLHEWKHRANQNLEWLSVDRVHQETLAVYGELITATP